MFKQIKFEINTKVIFEYLFIVWLITLPFGAKLLPIDLSFFTVYPNFIFSIFIVFFSLKTMKLWNRVDWLLIFFYLGWILLAFAYLSPKTNHYFALFDLRSLIMQLLFFVIFLNLHYELSADKIKELLKKGFKAYFYILLIFGCFEFFTGIHFDGHWIEKFNDLQVNNIFYAPIFIYDNSNDYLCYLLFFYLLNTIFDAKLQHNFHQKILFLTIIYIFSLFGDSKYGKLIILIIIVFELFMFYKKQLIINKNIVFTGSLLLLIFLYFSTEKFYGPMFNNSINYRLNEIKFIKKDANNFEIYSISKNCTQSEQKIISAKLDSLEISDGSIAIRKNLILNGLEFIKEKPIFGIGPGNYVKRHMDHDVRYKTSTVTSAHNFVIEIISQFGIFAWTYFGIFFILIVRTLKSTSHLNKKYIFLFYVIVPVLWMMPSSYLYLDINWLLLPLCYFHFNATSAV
jgi:hypothetical protein